jgi:hypothetical protein
MKDALLFVLVFGGPFWAVPFLLLFSHWINKK